LECFAGIGFFKVGSLSHGAIANTEKDFQMTSLFLHQSFLDDGPIVWFYIILIHFPV
jgi:hypothetical protein